MGYTDTTFDDVQNKRRGQATPMMPPIPPMSSNNAAAGGNMYRDAGFSVPSMSMGAGAAPTIYGNGGLPVAADRVNAKAPQPSPGWSAGGGAAPTIYGNGGLPARTGQLQVTPPQGENALDRYQQGLRDLGQNFLAGARDMVYRGGAAVSDLVNRGGGYLANLPLRPGSDFGGSGNYSTGGEFADKAFGWMPDYQQKRTVPDADQRASEAFKVRPQRFDEGGMGAGPNYTGGFNYQKTAGQFDPRLPTDPDTNNPRTMAAMPQGEASTKQAAYTPGVKPAANAGKQAEQAAPGVAEAQRVLADSKAKYGDGMNSNGGLASNREVPNYPPQVGLPQRTNVVQYDPRLSPGNEMANAQSAQGNDPWKDMARQLATFSALRAMDQGQGQPRGYTPSGPSVEEVARDKFFADADRRNQQRAFERDMSGARTQSQRQAILGMYQQRSNEDIARGHDAVTARGQDLNYQGHMAGVGVQARGQDMQAATAREGHGVMRDNAQLQAQSHLQGIDMQGRNQLANTALTGQNQLDVEQLKWNNPYTQAHAGYFNGLANTNNMINDALNTGDFDKANSISQASKGSFMNAYDKEMANHAQTRNKLIDDKGNYTPDDFSRKNSELDSAELQTRIRHGRVTQADVQSLIARAKARPEFKGKSDAEVQAAVMEKIHQRGIGSQGAGFANGGIVQEAGGVTRQNIGGIDHIVDPNAPGYNEFMGRGDTGGSFTNSAGQTFKGTGALSVGNTGNTITPNQQAQVGAGMVQRSAATGVAGVNFGDNSVAGLQARLTAMQQSNSSYAQGGPVHVGGRQVIGEGDGKSDSLPAMIDGEHPAALSTGEFVMPIEAVRHFGLDRLNKMVAQARKGGGLERQ